MTTIQRRPETTTCDKIMRDEEKTIRDHLEPEVSLLICSPQLNPKHGSSSLYIDDRHTPCRWPTISHHERHPTRSHTHGPSYSGKECEGKRCQRFETTYRLADCTAFTVIYSQDHTNAHWPDLYRQCDGRIVVVVSRSEKSCDGCEVGHAKGA